MDSPGHLQGHLDATAERDVVYCHACSNEWYREHHGLECPNCNSDITEIISPENDPRELNDGSASTSPEMNHPFSFGRRGRDRDHDHDQDHNHDQDSDPDEADIDEHLGPHGFLYRRSVRDRPGYIHHDTGVDPVLERFLGMLQEFTPRPRGGSHPLFPSARGEEGRYGSPQIHRATFTNGSGSASVTIFSTPTPGFFAPMPPVAETGSPTSPDAAADPFQTFFHNVLRDVPPPGERDTTAPAFMRGLQDILSLFHPANAVAGDAVYSQEALDQIITNLMEAHPQSNAAPPASNEALANLTRRPVDESMLDAESKTECTICIDDMNVGDLAAFLPCRHWFHEDCVVLWLKEHNTCPVCRASIEKSGESSSSSSSNNNNNNTNANANANSQADADANTPGPSRLRSPSQAEGPSGSGFSRTGPLPIPGTRPTQFPRPPSQSQSRLNEAMRSISSMQQERQQQERERERHRIWGISSNQEDRQAERERERDRIWGVPSSMNYDTSRMQRRSSRNSLSPTSPRMSSFADYRVRQRQGSPPQGSRRDGGNADSSRQTSSGPLGWLRDRFSGGGSRDDSSRDER